MSRQWSKILASSALFGSSTPAFSTTGWSGPQTVSSTATTQTIFGSPGNLGGPTYVPYASQVSIQANIGLQQNPSSGNLPGFGGTLNMLGAIVAPGNKPEKPNFVPIASTIFSSTGPVIVASSGQTPPPFNYVDFQIIPSTAINASSGGFATVTINVKEVF